MLNNYGWLWASFTANNLSVTDDVSVVDSWGSDSVSNLVSCPHIQYSHVTSLHQCVSYHEVEHLVSQFHEMLSFQYSYTFWLCDLPCHTHGTSEACNSTCLDDAFPHLWQHWGGDSDFLRHLCSYFSRCLQLTRLTAHCLKTVCKVVPFWSVSSFSDSSLLCKISFQSLHTSLSCNAYSR